MSGAFNGSMECANISIVNDNRLEENETFDIELTSSDPAVVLGNDVTTTTIIDDDGMQRLVLSGFVSWYSNSSRHLT